MQLTPREGKLKIGDRLCQGGTEECWENLKASTTSVCKIRNKSFDPWFDIKCIYIYIKNVCVCVCVFVYFQNVLSI